MIPTVEPIHAEPQDLSALAAAICYGRPDLREPAREAKMLAGLMKLDPPHLTLAEHARFTFEIDRPGVVRLELLTAAYGALYQRRRRDDKSLLSLNVSHIRHLAIEEASSFGRELAHLVRPLAPALVSDIPEHRGMPLTARLVPEEELTPAERKLYASRSFKIVCSRIASHQAVRHRTVSWEQRSHRQPNRNGATFAFIWPPALIGKMSRAEDDALHQYDFCIRNGVNPEDARYLLPGAVATTLIATAPTRAWRHFLRLRGERKAQAEIRWAALLIRDHLAETCPEAVEGIEVDTAGLGPYLERRGVDDAAD